MNGGLQAAASEPHDECILSFFELASTALQNLDLTKCGTHLSLADCRRFILEKQKSILHQSVPNDVAIADVQQRLAKLKQDKNLSLELKTAMDALEDGARLVLCKLVLYNQESRLQEKDHKTRNVGLQTVGRLDRSRLLEFIALNRAAVKLPIVRKYLVDGPPLFDNLQSTAPEAQASARRFPQPRLEYIQRLLSRAVGWDPEFTTRELRRIFFDNSTSKTNEYSEDQEILQIFRDLMVETKEAIARASARACQQQLSDMDQGGVTRVVSVQYSEVTLNNPEAGKYNASAPKKVAMENVELSEEEQKRQIRLASEAAVMQQEILADLFNMSEYERNNKLQEAQVAADDFSQRLIAIPPGPERISFLRSIDSHTSRLLLLHKLWNSMLMSNGGKLPTISKK